MVRTALLIEHDTDVMEGAYDQIISLGDGCEVVSCQQEARERFFDERDKFDYIVCEINLPARRNSPAPSCENAARFMKEVKSFSPTPFFVLADIMLIAKGYAAKMMKEGADILHQNSAVYIRRLFCSQPSPAGTHGRHHNAQ
jgi:hypothetical protein